MRPGVRLDFRHVADGAILQPEDLQRELARIGYCLSPLDIVLINTAAGARYGQPDYLQRGCGIGRAATLWLLEQGVRVVGTDAWSWDAPFHFTRERFQASGDAGLIWEGIKPAGDRLWANGEAEQPGAASRLRLLGELLSLQDPPRFGRVYPRGGDCRRLKLRKVMLI